MRSHSRDIPPPLYVGALVDTKTSRELATYKSNSARYFLLVVVYGEFLSYRRIISGHIIANTLVPIIADLLVTVLLLKTKVRSFTEGSLFKQLNRKIP